MEKLEHCKLIAIRKSNDFDHFLVSNIRFSNITIWTPYMPGSTCFRSTLLFTLNSFGILALSNSRSSLIFYLEPPFYSTLIPNSTSFYSLSFFSTFFPFWVHDFSFFILYIESLISSFQFTWILNFSPFCEFHRVPQVLLSISNSILFRIHNFSNSTSYYNSILSLSEILHTRRNNTWKKM